jgi:hypothetical protein
MQNVISKLVKQREVAQNELKLITTAIEGLQNVCEHKSPLHQDTMVYQGSGHKDDLYKCSICGKQEYR